MLALPSSGRREPPPPRTLLLVHRSYRLIRQSPPALLSFGYSPRARSLCRLLPAPAAGGTFPTLVCESFLRCLSPYPSGLLSAFAWFFLSIHRPSPSFEQVGFPLHSANTTFHGSAYEAAAISLCSGLPVCSPPRSFLPLQVFLAGQPRLFTSEQNVRRYLRTHRTRYPPDYRQLAERGLPPRKIRSLVSCSRMMPPFPPSSLRCRTAGFPRYSSKAGLSDGAFPALPPVKPAPGNTLRQLRFASILRASRGMPTVPVLSRGQLLGETPPFNRYISVYPRGPRSGPGYVVPVHHHLIGPIRPTRGHIAISSHCDLYAMPSLCGSA